MSTPSLRTCATDSRAERESVRARGGAAPELRKAAGDASEILRLVCCRLELERAEAHAAGRSTYMLAAVHADIVRACAELESALGGAGP